jgi:hypothetical protein
VLRRDDREGAALAQDSRRLLVAQLRIDPVERRERDDRVESRVRRVPGLEVGGDDLDVRKAAQVSPSPLGELLAELDARDPKTATGER